MNIFCFWTASGTAHYVAAHSANEAFGILQRLDLAAKIADFSQWLDSCQGEVAAVFSDSGDGSQMKSTGYFRAAARLPGEQIRYELIKDGDVV